MAQPFPDVTCVLWQGLLRQDGVCLARVHELHHPHVQRATVHAESDRECRGLLCVQLGLFHVTADPPDLIYRKEAARGLVDVHDAVCADCVLVHQPAQLDEEPVRVGVLLLRAVELLQALGRLLEAQAQEVGGPISGRDGRRVPSHSRAAASWADRASASCTCLVANSDQQTKRWRRARPARRRGRRNPDQLTTRSAC